MWDSAQPPVLVGIGPHTGDPVLAVAAREARRRGCGVHLLHVLGKPPATPVPTGTDPTGSEVAAQEGHRHKVGEMVLAEAGSRLTRYLDAGTRVSTELGQGSVVATFEAVSEHACVLVLGNAHASRHLGPTVTSAGAARSRCPVLAVPDGVDLEAAGDVAVITLGLHDVAASLPVLRVACDQADRADARLRIVHVGDAGGSDDDDDEGTAVLHAAVARVLATHPLLPVDVVVSRGDAAAVLMAQATDAELLVVGRHVPRHPTESRLGSVVRAVLMRHPGQVLVVDPAPVGPADHPHERVPLP